MASFALFGVAGHNRGDDAIALGVIAGLRAAFPGCAVAAATLKGAPGRLAAADRTITIDRRSIRGLWAMLRAIAAADAVLLGGGSLIQDRLGGSRIKGVLGYAWTVTLLARLCRRPVYTVPLGVDELRTGAATDAAREVLGRIDWLALRDARSLAEARRIAPALHGAEVFCDPAFGWEPALPATPHAGCIVLSPAFEGVDDALVVEMFAGIAGALLARDPSRPIAILAMDSRAEEDGGKIARIRDALPEAARRSPALIAPETAEEAAAVLRQAHAVIAMRLHAVILAYGHARCFCLSRTTKTTALMRERGVDGVEYGGMPVAEVVARAVAAADDDSRLGPQRRQRARLREVAASYYAELKRRLEADGVLDRAG